jgi:hypothetical protein
MNRDPDFENFTLPLRSFELGTSSHHGSTFLKTASRVFPKIEELILWNFDPLSEIAFANFKDWSSFKHLSVLKLNNVSFVDLHHLVQDVGHQIQILEIDNFRFIHSGAIYDYNRGYRLFLLHYSIDDTPMSKIDLGSICTKLPNLVQLTLTMCHCSFVTDNIPRDFRLPHLTRLYIKGVTFDSNYVVQELLSVSPSLEKLYLYSKFDMFLRRGEDVALAPEVAVPPLQHFDLIPPARFLGERPLSDDRLERVFRRNPLANLRVFVVTVIDQEMGFLKLTEARSVRSLFGF